MPKIFKIIVIHELKLLNKDKFNTIFNNLGIVESIRRKRIKKPNNQAQATYSGMQKTNYKNY
jgi:hypothetical protein